MKLSTFISAGAFIFFSAMIIRKNERIDQEINLYTNQWYLLKIYGDSTITVRKDTGQLNYNYIVDFSSFKFIGRGACNLFRGKCSIFEKSLIITEINSDRMYCPGPGNQATETAFLSNLKKTTRYEIHGDKLTLYRYNSVLLKFRNGPD